MCLSFSSYFFVFLVIFVSSLRLCLYLNEISCLLVWSHIWTLFAANQLDGRGSIKELFPTGKQLEPLVAPLADGKVAVGQDDLTVVLNEEGVCTQKCALNWTDIPIAMGKELFPSVDIMFDFNQKRQQKAKWGTSDNHIDLREEIYVG